MKKLPRPPKFVLRKCLFTILTVIGINHSLIAQDIDFSVCGTYAGVVEPLVNPKIGEAINFSLGAINAGSVVTMSIKTISVNTLGTLCSEPPFGTACPVPTVVPVSGTNITFAISPDQTHVNITSPLLINPALAGITFTFTLTASRAANTPCERTYSFTITRKPVDLVMVLDISGSMNDPSPSCPITPCPKKIDVLRNSAKQFIDIWGGINTVPGDRIGIVYFNSGVLRDDVGMAALDDFIANKDAMKTNIGSKSASGATAMGGGIETALDDLTSSTNQKIIILFTDGMQNQNPMVNLVTNAIENQNGHFPTTGVVPDPYHTISSGLNTKIYSIGVGATNDVFAGLKTIAMASGVIDATSLSYNIQDLLFMFPQSFVSVLRGSSPQIIDYRKVLLPVVADGSSTATEKFTLNEGAANALFAISWNSLRALGTQMRILKDGVDVTQFGKVITDSLYKMFSIQFPVKGNNSLHSGGEWQMVITGRPQTEYWIYSMTDDHNLKYKSSFGVADDRVGNPLPLSVQVDLNGSAVTDSCQIRAVILKPNQDFGTLFSNSTAPKVIPSESGLTAGQQKFAQLSTDPAFSNKLIPKEQNMLLSHQGNGRYTATFNDTKESGPYRVVYFIEGQKSGTGTFKRIETVSTIIQFAHVDPAASVKNYTFLNNVWQLTVLPKNIYGNLLGPDYISKITVVPSSGTVNDVKDNLNGSYTYTLAGVPAGTIPNVNITVLGEPFYNGPINEINKPSSSFSLGAHIGRTFPTGNFGKFFNPGWLAEVNAEYQFSRHFSAELAGGYYTFDSSFKVIGGTLYGKAHATLNSLHLYAGPGLGIYKPDNIKASFGISGKIGVQRAVSNKLTLDLNGAYFHLFTPNQSLDFFTAALGFKYFF